MTVLPDGELNRLRIAFAKISRLVDRQVGGGDLTRSELSVLGTVARSGSVGMRDLADIEGLNPTMLSRVVGKLEAEGLFSRTAAAEDRRSVVVEITPAGSKRHEKLRRQRTALFAARLAEVPDAEVDALLAALPALESLAEALRRSSPAAAARAVQARTGQATLSETKASVAR